MITPERARPLHRRAASLSMVSVERVVDCPFSLSLEKAQLIFGNLEAPDPSVRILFRSLGIPVSGGFTHRVTVRFHREPDLTEWGRSHDEIDFAWDAQKCLSPNRHHCAAFSLLWMLSTAHNARSGTQSIWVSVR